MNSATHLLTTTINNLLKYQYVNSLDKLPGNFNEDEY